MSPPPDDPLRASRFRDLYATTHADVVRFVRRRVGPDVSDDVAHEAFLVAWRRLDDIPVDHGAARAWLFTTARNVLLNERRGAARRDALPIRLAPEHDPAGIEAIDETISLRLDLEAAWPRLAPDHQEALSLAVWDDRSSTEAGRVLGISAASYRIRLHRARGAATPDRHPRPLGDLPHHDCDGVLTMRTDPHLDALRTLDAAPRGAADDASRRRATARLEQILATDPADTTASGARVSPRRSKARPRWLVLPAVTVAAVGALVIVPAVTRPDPAYASWTSAPMSLTDAEETIAVTACVDADGGLTSAEPLLAERRGEWVGVVIAGETTPGTPAVTNCLMHLPSGSDHADDVTAGSTGGQGAVPVGTEFTDGSISQFSDNGLFGLGARPTVSFNVGDVGADVAAVTIVDADGQTVHATVDNGRFVAWWPGRAFGGETEGNGGPAPALTYDLTLRDGTVVTDAEPTLPD